MTYLYSGGSWLSVLLTLTIVLLTLTIVLMSFLPYLFTVKTFQLPPSSNWKSWKWKVEMENGHGKLKRKWKMENSCGNHLTHRTSKWQKTPCFSVTTKFQ